LSEACQSQSDCDLWSFQMEDAARNRIGIVK
jgi:hypothetical protein